MKEFWLNGRLRSYLLSFSLLFLFGFGFPQGGQKSRPEQPAKKGIGATIQKSQEAPKVSTEINLPADAFKGFYYVEPILWGETIYLAVVKRKSLSSNLMKTCDEVIYEDPEHFGPEVADFIKPKRKWARIDGSISILSKGHFEICRNLFQQPTVSDLCVSADLGIGMDGRGESGGLQGFDIPNVLTGKGAGERGAERVGAPDVGQGLGQRLSGQVGGAGGGRPSFGGPEFGMGGDGGAGSFLWNYDPCSNQNCVTSGGSSQGFKGFSGLGSTISGFGRAIIDLSGGGGGESEKSAAGGGSGSGGLGRQDPRMMEEGGGGTRREGRTGYGEFHPKGGDSDRKMLVQSSWTVDEKTGSVTFDIKFSCNFNCNGGTYSGQMNGRCELSSDSGCQRGVGLLYAASKTEDTRRSGILQGAAASALHPSSEDAKLKEQQKMDEFCKNNPDDPKCVERREAYCEKHPDDEQCKKDKCAKNPDAPECGSEEDPCEKDPDDPKCKPDGGNYPACDVPGQTGCDGEFAAFIPVAKVKEFLESGGKKGLVIYPLPEGNVPLEAPGELPAMDPLAPFINPVPDEGAGTTTLSSNATPCGGQTQDILTGTGGGSKPTKGNLLNCPEGTLPGPQGCRPIVNDGRGGGGGCLPGQPDCPGPTD